MNNIVRKNIIHTLRHYVTKAREHGFTDEELRRVVEETQSDVRRAMKEHAKNDGRPVTLTSLLQIRHHQMVERREQNNQ